VPILSPAVLAATLLGADAQASFLTLVDATRVAMERNPELAEAVSSARAAGAGARAAGALPEPMLSYQAWQQPLSRPLDAAATNMHSQREHEGGAAARQGRHAHVHAEAHRRDHVRLRDER